ncbi:MAG: DUF4468 domain-containing protein, partial [Odoribacter sp.]|nr:DUF4468 domain-containing protein [Odoribacter sp.]
MMNYFNPLRGIASMHCSANTNMDETLFSTQEKGQITCLGQKYLVFTNTALSLDQSLMTYQMSIECHPEKCNLKINAIYYLYNIAGKNERLLAEEQITDENVFNKKRDKMLKATGKFRTHTIDLVETLFDSAEKALGGTPAPAIQALPSPEQVIAAIPASGTSTLPGYKQITPDKIPGNIYKMLSENWMLVCAGNQDNFNMMTASWGGLGHLYNKPVTFCFINPTRHTYQLLEDNDTYTLCFFTEAYREALNYCGTHSGKNEDKVKGSGLTPMLTPSGSTAYSEAWMIIECKKLVAQSFSPEIIFNPETKSKWGEARHKMFIGEILNVWVK